MLSWLIYCELANFFQSKALALVCSYLRAHTYFVLNTEIVSVSYLIWEEELSSCAVFNYNFLVCGYWLTKSLDSQIRIVVKYFPSSVINWLSNHANLLVAWETSKSERANLSAVQVKFLPKKIRIAFKSDLLSISHNIIMWAIIFDSSNRNDWARAGSNFFISCSASISLIIWSDFIARVKDQNAIWGFVLEHNWITESYKTVLRKCLRDLNIVNGLISLLFDKTWLTSAECDWCLNRHSPSLPCTA